MNYLIGIDLGTSSTKTVLFDEKGERNCFRKQRLSFVHTTQRLGRAETGRLARCCVRNDRKSCKRIRCRCR